MTYDPNCWKWVGHTLSTLLMDDPFRSPFCSMIAVRSVGTDCVTGNPSHLEEATVFIIRMSKADRGGACTHSTYSPWSTIYALTCLGHTSRLVHEDSNWEDVYSRAMVWLGGRGRCLWLRQRLELCKGCCVGSCQSQGQLPRNCEGRLHSWLVSKVLDVCGTCSAPSTGPQGRLASDSDESKEDSSSPP